MRPVRPRLLAAALTLPAIGGITLVGATAPATAEPVIAAPVSAAPAATDIADLKAKASNLESEVAKFEKKANKANHRLDKVDASLGKADKALAKAKKRKKTAAKKLAHAGARAEAARQDLGLIEFGVNLTRRLEAEADAARTGREGDPGLIDVASVEHLADDVPTLADVSVEATAAEREATMTAIQADWAGAGASADLREASRAASKAAVERDEVAKVQKKASAAAGKADKKLDKAGDKLDSVQRRLATAVENKQAAERRAAAEKAARAAADRTAQPGTGHTTSPYGMRTHPITGVHKLHSGTDFSYGDGRAYAARSGTVAEVSYSGAYGNMVTISHGASVQTRYAHLSSPTVSTGERVSAGDVVGQIGSTGYSTGPHLHFEVLKHGEFVNADAWLGQ